MELTQAQLAWVIEQAFADLPDSAKEAMSADDHMNQYYKKLFGAA